MKWGKIGHEYDDLFQKIDKKKVFYLFGMGDYGNQFYQVIKDEIQIKGFIDNNIEKQRNGCYGEKCISIEDVMLEKDEGIIVTMSQFARIGAIEQLIRYGYKKDIDFFIIEEFLSVYYVYKYNKVYFSSISFLPSTICNLNCRYCLNFNPFAEKFYKREWNALVRDVDLFFSRVDYIMLFHVSGGEPLLYEYTSDLIHYIDNKYGNRIGKLRVATNGTIIPDDDVFEKISQCNVEFTVDDYRDAVPEYKERFDLLIKKLKENNINYYINKVDSWFNLAPEKTDYTYMTEQELQKHREDCNQSWQELRDGKLYNCNYAAYATVAGIAGEQDLEEVYDLIEGKNVMEKKKELVEFRLGYTTKGYTNFCKKCRGFTLENSERVKPAEQVK